MLQELVVKNRAYRRFDNDVKISNEQIQTWLENSRFVASAANIQPLRFRIVSDVVNSDIVFANLKWAGYLKDWDGPTAKERPSAYLIILSEDTGSNYVNYDAGIFSQTFLLNAVEAGFGGCIFAAINREEIKRKLLIPIKYEILTIIAIGKPIELVKLESTSSDIKYWRDDKQIHHVPKRKLKDLII